MSYKVKLLNKHWLTHDVTQLRFEKPEGFEYEPGEAIEMTLNEEGPAPFTLTCLNTKDYLEFMIKTYPDHNGTTEQIAELKEGEEVEITEPFVTYSDKGAGVFIAGGAGITPFVAILRSKFEKKSIDDCTLIFANKKRKDIFLEEELRTMLGEGFINVLSREEKGDPDYYGRIDEAYLKSHIRNFNQPFYLCGPEGFSEGIKEQLEELGADVEQVMLSD